MRVAGGGSLTREEAQCAMGTIMAGEATPAQIGALLAALHVRGETVEEITGFASSLRSAAVAVVLDTDGAIDTCGTGGDRSRTFNISTVAAIVAAAAGARVAKHGNRAASSSCGSADVLEALGIRIDLGPDGVAACIREAGIGFMFAPRFHPAMRHAAPVRGEIGIRTVFNVLGPLANPAGVRRQLLGVPSVSLGETMAAVLRDLGAERALVVHGGDGLDEITTSGETLTWELRDGSIRSRSIDPRSLGVPEAPRAALVGGDAKANAAIATRVLEGVAGAQRSAVLLNAGAACYVAGLAGTVREGVDLAARTIDSGAARERLDRFAAASEQAAGRVTA